MNLRAADFRDQIAVYVNCAATLAKSLRQHGLDFTLLTNDAAYIQSVSPSAGLVRIEEIEFRTDVPKSAAFYSAHFKLDVFRYLATIDCPYVAFCDLDMVCIGQIPAALIRNVEHSVPMCYDISDQVICAYGASVIAGDLQRLHGQRSEGRWYGGEFIAGSPDFFVELSRRIADVYDNYVSNIGALHHVGDEAVTSAALELMKHDGINVADAGPLGIVGRYWNTDVRHVQRDIAYYMKGFLLHLPADKRFLSSVSDLPSSKFIDYGRLYREHIFSMKNRAILALRRIRNSLRGDQKVASS